MQLRHLLKGVEVINDPPNLDDRVSSVCYSANKCVAGSLFVAIKGLQHDGHDFIHEAITKGARFVVYENDVSLSPIVTAIRVKNSRDSLGILAKNYFGSPADSLVLVGVIGTSGKTTITYLLESIFKEAGFKCGVLGTINYRYKDKTFPAPNTTPESYEMHKILREMSDEGITHVIAEVSSHAIDLRRVDSCDFDLGIFTNLTRSIWITMLPWKIIFRRRKGFFPKYCRRAKKIFFIR
jgi:UDP-N-acetylmuramyl tripeptide synthase